MADSVDAMADSDDLLDNIRKTKVTILRKELKSRGLLFSGTKEELVARLHAAIIAEKDAESICTNSATHESTDYPETESSIETKSSTETLSSRSEDAAFGHTDPQVSLKLTAITDETKKECMTAKGENAAETVVYVSTVPKVVKKEPECKSIVTATLSDFIRVNAHVELDPKARLVLRAKRFGLPVKMTENERMEARKRRFSPDTPEHLDKLKKRADRFRISVPQFVTDIEKKMEKRKIRFGTFK